MAKQKEFDCVELQNKIQADIQKENEGLNDEQRREKLHRELNASDGPLSRKWREWKRANPRSSASAVAKS